MSPSTFARAALAVGLLTSTASAAFDKNSKTNVAMYWGQGSNQISLSQVCADPNIDIVNIGFVNYFPRTLEEYPGTNHANACEADWYPDPTTGKPSKLLRTCPGVEQAIKDCQSAGKKVMLSVGGGYPLDYSLPTVDLANYFADFLIGAYGPITQAWGNRPRPFGSAVLDGFDLDLEAEAWATGSDELIYKNYDVFAQRIKSRSTMLLSAAPQCVVPDARITEALKAVEFDFIFAQFYNTFECSAMKGYLDLSVVGAQSTTFTFDAWLRFLKYESASPNAKLFLGLPAGPDGLPVHKEQYLTPTQADFLINKYKNSQNFGGVMLWEATVSVRNVEFCQSFGYWMKASLDGSFAKKHNKSACPVSSSVIVSSSTMASSSSSSLSSSSASSSTVATSSSRITSSSSSSSSSSKITSSSTSSSSSSKITSSSASSASSSSKITSSSAISSSSSKITSSSTSSSSIASLSKIASSALSSSSSKAASSSTSSSSSSKPASSSIVSSSSSRSTSNSATSSSSSKLASISASSSAVAASSSKTVSSSVATSSSSKITSSSISSSSSSKITSSSTSSSSSSKITSSSTSSSSSSKITSSSTSSSSIASLSKIASSALSSSSSKAASSSMVLSSSKASSSTTSSSSTPASSTAASSSSSKSFSSTVTSSSSSKLASSTVISSSFSSIVASSASKIASSAAVSSSNVASSPMSSSSSKTASSTAVFSSSRIASVIVSSSTVVAPLSSKIASSSATSSILSSGAPLISNIIIPGSGASSSVQVPARSSVFSSISSSSSPVMTSSVKVSHGLTSSSVLTSSNVDSSSIHASSSATTHSSSSLSGGSSSSISAGSSSILIRVPIARPSNAFPSGSASIAYPDGYPTDASSTEAYSSVVSTSEVLYLTDHSSYPVATPNAVSTTSCSSSNPVYSGKSLSVAYSPESSKVYGEYTPSSIEKAYESVPSVTQKFQDSPSYPTEASITVVTTAYVDVCSTGLTTITAVITKTVCTKCAHPTKEAEYPQGWTTSVYMDKTTTITLTKPIHTSTNVSASPVTILPVQSVNYPSTLNPSGSVNKEKYPSKPESAIVAIGTKAVEQPASSKAPAYPAQLGVAGYPKKPVEDVASPVVSALVQHVTLSKVSVPAAYTPAPYQSAAVSSALNTPIDAGNGTSAYYAMPTGTGKPTKPSSYSPTEFEGAASRLGVGFTAVVAVVAGLLAL